MNLRARITLIVSLSFVLLAVGLAFAFIDQEERAAERLTEATLRAQETVWQKVVDKLTQGMAVKSATVRETAGLGEVVARGDRAQVLAVVQPVFERLRDERTITRLDIADAGGEIVYTSKASLAPKPLVDAGVLAKIVDQNLPADGVQEDEGRLMATVSYPIGAGDRVVGVLTLARDLEPALAEVKDAIGADVFVLDRKGAMVYATDKTLWSRIGDGWRSLGRQLHTLERADKVYALAVLGLSNGSGSRLGHQVAVRDITAAHERDSFIRNATVAAIFAFFLLILVSLYAYLQRAFAPLDGALDALNALSAGDTTVEIEGESRSDEIGRIARAVRIFRDHELGLKRSAMGRTRRRRRQQRFIRQQMLGLAETLDERARQEVLDDLEQIESAARSDGAKVSDELGDLAVAFQVMSRRVKDQHERLDRLVGELREALAAKTELIGLQQQLEIANRMQRAILPRGFPPRPDVEIAGELAPAKEFGGDFYDYFFIDQDNVAVVAAQVGGGGLPAVFLAVSARTLVKATVLGGAAPGACLARVNDMMAGENEDDLPVSLFLGVLDLRSGTLTYAAAGYATPVMMHRLGEVEQLPFTEDPPLGLRHGLVFLERRLDVPARTTLVLTSSGVAAVNSASGAALGRDGVLAALKNCDDLAPTPLVGGLMAAVAGHAAGVPQDRDASCVALRYLGR